MIKRFFAVLLLAAWPGMAGAECIVSTDCYFDYTPKLLSDATRDTTLTIGSTSDLDIFAYYEDDSTYGSAETEDTTPCPPEASEVGMDHQGNGRYVICVDAALITTSGKRLCLDVQDAQGTATVYDDGMCQEVWAEDRLIAADNVGINWADVANPTTAVDLSATDIQLVDTVTTYTGNTVQTGDNYARLGAPAGASVSADVAAVKAETTLIAADTGTDGVLLAATATSAQLVDDVWDEILTGATHNVATSSGRRLRGIQEFQGYENGAIWVDTVNGTAGTVNYENGTVENPVLTWADALTLATSLGFTRYEIVNGSTITLAATLNNSVLKGDRWTLALGGQDVGGSHFEGAVVSGTSTGTEAHYIDCTIGTATLSNSHLERSKFSGTVTLSATGDYHIADSHSGIAGASTPVIDMGAAVANTNLNIRSYSGGVEIRNFNQSGTDNFSMEGQGQVVYAASSSGTVNQRGEWKVTNTGGVTITADDNTTNIGLIVADTGTDGVLLAATATSAQLVDDVWDEVLTGATHNVTNSAGKKLRQAADVIAYSGTVNDAGATATVFIIDNGASAVDDFYNDQTIVITDGALDGQAQVITDYVGATRTVTVDEGFTSAPANGVGIQIVADHVHPVSQIAGGVWDETTTGHTTAGTFGEQAKTDIDAILVDTTEIGTAGAGLTDLGGMSTGMQAEVNTEVDGSMVTYGLDHLLAASVTGTDVIDDSIIAQLVSKSATADWDSYDNTTDADEAIRDRGDVAWITGGASPNVLQSTTIATLASQTSFTLTAGSADDSAYADQIIIVTDSVTSEQKAVGAISAYTGSTKTITLSPDPGIFTMAVGDTVDIIAATGAAGTGLTAQQTRDAMKLAPTAGSPAGGSVDEHLDDILTDTATTIPGTITTVQNDLDVITGSDGVFLDSTNDETVITDAVWDEGTSGHVGAGTTGLALSDIDTATSALTVAGIVDGVWDEATSGHVGAGSTGEALTDNTGATLTTAAEDSLVDKTWDELTSGHTTAGTTGKALTDASSAGDPWSTALPGAYGAGTAGDIIGNDIAAVLADTSTDGVVLANDAITAAKIAAAAITSSEAPNLDAAVSTRATASALSTMQTDVTGILADTADMQPKMGTPAADLSADIAAVKVDTAAIKVDTAAILVDTGTDGVVLTAAQVTAVMEAVRDMQVEAVGAYSLQEVLSLLAAYAFGDGTKSGSSFTYKTVDGVTTRFTGTNDGTTRNVTSTTPSAP